MNDVLRADAVDDDTVRVELDGETHDLSVAVAEQLSRDLDAAIETLRDNQCDDTNNVDDDNYLGEEFVEINNRVEGLDHIVKE